MIVRPRTRNHTAAAALCMLLTVILIAPITVVAQEPTSKPLTFTPLTKDSRIFQPGQEKDTPAFLNLIFKLGVGVAALLAVIMIVVGGFEYMTSEIPGAKNDGKDRIRGAIYGLLLVLLTWLILTTVNPDILNFSIRFPSN